MLSQRMLADGRAAAGIGLVDHIVVVERRQVHQLDRHGAADQARVGRVAEVAGQEHQHGAEPLAAGGDQVRRRLGEQPGRFHAHGLLQRLLDLVEARADVGLQRRVRRLESRGSPFGS